MNSKNETKFKSIKSKYLLFIFCGMLSFGAYAQSITVTGTVISSEDNFPLPGVAVVVEGTSTGTVTDFDGNYTLKANIGDKLRFSYISMLDEIIAVTKSEHNVSMTPSVEDLEEVVVVGYGTIKKKEIIGAVGQVKADDIEQFITPDLASTLQGQIAGVNVTASSGQPGAEADIQIRGITSLSGSNTPLFVVDGIPQNGNPGLSPNEIETIDVLKDAASAAVYGTRGASGVILITTKKGEAGVTKVTFNHNYGIQHLQNFIPLMNTEQQLAFDVNRFTYGGWPFNPGPNNNPEWINNDNDFRDIVLKDAETESYTLNVSGGTKNFTYNVVGGYINIGGVVLNSGFKRYNARATTTFTSENWKIDTSIAFNLDDNLLANNGLINNAIRYNPWFPIVDRDSETFFTNGDGGVTTPLNGLAQSLKNENSRKYDKINGSLSLKRNLLPGLDFTTRLGVNVTNEWRHNFTAKFEVIDVTTGESEVEVTNSGVTMESSRQTLLSWDGSFNYKKKIGDHNFNLLATTALEERRYSFFGASKQGVADNTIRVLDGATVFPLAYSGGNDYTFKTLGFLGRLQYNYKGKYLFSVLARRDGSSKFGEDFRWGTFPSYSAGWNVSNEGFWKPLKSTINNFKLRFSHGTVGNESFPAYQFSSGITQLHDYIFDVTDSNFALGTAIQRYANSDVKWETSIQDNFGVDLGFFKNKLILTADYYNTEKRDMLFPVRLPSSTGVDGANDDIILNVGNMTNEGIELALKYYANLGKSKLNFGVTFAKNENEITNLGGTNSIIYNANSSIVRGISGIATALAEGYEAGAFFIHETNGVVRTQEQLDAYRALGNRENADFGDIIYVDQLTVDTNGDGVPDEADGVINDEDRIYQGSGLPDFEMGFNFGWKYKNFDLTMNWYGTVGSEIMNGVRAEAYSAGRHTDLVNMWTPNNPNSNIPIFRNRAGQHFNFEGGSDLYLENGDYLRLRLISLGYTLPKDVMQRIGLTNLRVYLTAQNPLTITNYSGYDPEIGGNVTTRGLDRQRYPVTAIYSVGLKLDF